MVETAPLRWKELRVVSGDMSDIKRPAVSMACMAQVPRAKHTRVIGGPGSREGDQNRTMVPEAGRGWCSSAGPSLSLSQQAQVPCSAQMLAMLLGVLVPLIHRVYWLTLGEWVSTYPHQDLVQSI